MSPIRAAQGCWRGSTCPQGWHSHKVRVANGIMIVNHERNGPDGDTAFGGGLGIYDVSKPGEPQADRQMAHPRQGRASLRFRRPLRLYLADGRGLCRQHRHDPRPQGSGEAGRGRALVDSRAVEGRRRGLSLGRLDAAALPPSRCAWATGSMSAIGITATTSSTSPTCRSRRLIAGGNTSPAFPHPTHTCLPIPQAAEGPQDHGGGGRGCGEALAGGAGLRLDLRHHQRDTARSRSPPSRWRAWTRTARRSRR